MRALDRATTVHLIVVLIGWLIKEKDEPFRLSPTRSFSASATRRLLTRYHNGSSSHSGSNGFVSHGNGHVEEEDDDAKDEWNTGLQHIDTSSVEGGGSEEVPNMDESEEEPPQQLTIVEVDRPLDATPPMTTLPTVIASLAASNTTSTEPLSSWSEENSPLRLSMKRVLSWSPQSSSSGSVLDGSYIVSLTHVALEIDQHWPRGSSSHAQEPLIWSSPLPLQFPSTPPSLSPLSSIRMNGATSLQLPALSNIPSSQQSSSLVSLSTLTPLPVSSPLSTLVTSSNGLAATTNHSSVPPIIHHFHPDDNKHDDETQQYDDFSASLAVKMTIEDGFNASGVPKNHAARHWKLNENPRNLSDKWLMRHSSIAMFSCTVLGYGIDCNDVTLQQWHLSNRFQFATRPVLLLLHTHLPPCESEY
jgi:hypothetical protein